MKTTFKQLAIGTQFEFPGPNRSFFEVCTKVSIRCYTWRDRITGKTIKSQVGSIKVEVSEIKG